MIVHDPLGNEDPYKSSPGERFPRAPAPGDAVQVGFRVLADALEAWADVTRSWRGQAETVRVPAVKLAGDAWSAEIGAFEGGAARYLLHARLAEGGQVVSAGPFDFDVGEWVAVTGVAGVERSGAGALAELTTDRGKAYLSFEFPIGGACRLSLTETPPPGHAAPQGDVTLERGAAGYLIRGPGIVLDLDPEGLALTASRPSGSPLYRGGLGFRWLERRGALGTRVVATFETAEGEALYGLGERFVNADRNGQKWDVRVYEEYKEQRKRTYIPVPLLVSEKGYGVWLDAAEPSELDLRSRLATVTVERLRAEPGGAPRSLLELVVLVADEPYGVTAAFTELTGTPAVPPAWAFGPWMSANTWSSQALVEEVVARTVAEDVPASVVVIEAWSDEATFYVFNDAEYEPKGGGEAHSLADFRFTGRWPDPKAMIDLCHEHGVRVVLWQIPVHKRLGEPHAQHDLDGAYLIENGLVIANADGSPYRNKGWWFTDALVADFSNPATRDLWFGKRRYLFEELGIDGMKTDGGEHIWGSDLRSHDGRRGLELFNTYPNDYVGAYHAFVQEATRGNGVTFSRAGYAGAQRYPIHWAGDEDSTWNAYRASVKAGLSAGVSGVGMWTWDLAGFSGEVPPVDLYVRAAAMAAFCPIMQYHSEWHGVAECRDRTPWNIAERHRDPRALSIYRHYAHLRMRLRDYLHAEAQAAAAAGLPLMRYPALVYPERHDFLAEDEYAYLLGRDLLVAPVTERGAETREVRLPPGTWVDLWSGSSLGGDRLLDVPAPLDTIPVFVDAASESLGLLLAAAGACPWAAMARVTGGATRRAARRAEERG